MNFFTGRRKNIARIPADQLDRLKTEISLQCLTEGMGIVLKRHGADLLGLCPFHDDKEPSLVISPKNKLALPRMLAGRRARNICAWGDETRIRSDCQHGRGYSPKGKTLVIRLSAKCSSVNMISTVAHQGKV